MSAEAPLAVRGWKVGLLRCILIVPQPRAGAVVSAVIEWSPRLPRRLTERQLEQYRAGRDSAIAEIGQQLGIAIGVLEL